MENKPEIIWERDGKSDHSFSLPKLLKGKYVLITQGDGGESTSLKMGFIDEIFPPEKNSEYYEIILKEYPGTKIPVHPRITSLSVIDE